MNPVGPAGFGGPRRTFDCVAHWKASLSDYYGYKAELNKTLIGTVIGSYRFSSGNGRSLMPVIEHVGDLLCRILMRGGRCGEYDVR
jgi:hypothetical protein